MFDTFVTAAAIDATNAIRWTDLGMDPIALDLGFFQLRWYSLAYLAGILAGWWYLLRLVQTPGSPMARRHADDMVFYATLGVILGGRLGYVIFYKPAFYLENPGEILQLWDGGMSFHGGVIGVTLGILYMARTQKLDWLRIHDYVAMCVPFGLFTGRLANFVNGELWGRPTDVPWGVVFPTGGDVPRHPSQLYEAGLEGLLLFAVLWVLFWRTNARYQPGKLVGTFILGYGLSRFFVEFFRSPDAHLTWLPEQTGLSMGQWLCMPMILGGVYLIMTAKSRAERVRAVPAEPAPASV